MKRKSKKKIRKDKDGRDFIKETYFIGGKMKSRRVYVIDGIPMEEFYQNNGTDLDFFLNGDYELMSQNEVVKSLPSEKNESDLTDDKNSDDLPF